MVRSLKLFFKNYFNFRGRAARSEFWWPVVVFACVQSLLGNVAFVALRSALAAEEPISNGFAWLVMGSWAAVLILALGCVIPFLSVMVRRLHDIGRSGWWLLTCLIPAVGGVVFLVFMLLDSQAGPNQWGHNPRNRIWEVL